MFPLRRKYIIIRTFFSSDLWKLRLDSYSPGNRFMLWILRLLILTGRGFRGDYLKVRASSLSFYTLLAIVPLLAMGFGIAKGFGYDTSLEAHLINNFKGQEEVLVWLIKFSRTLLESVKGGLMAAIGFVLLFWSVVQVMTLVEGSFNDIWGVKKSRSFVRRFADYLAMLVVVPIIIMVASGTNVLFITQLRDMSSNSWMIEIATPFLMVLIKVVPYILIWMAFTLMYMVMPHTRVKWQAALLSGVFMGTVFQLVEWFYINLQVGVSRYSAVYGSFAALPLLLLWMQVGWLIILFGAEMSYAIQNMEMHEFEKEASDMSAYERRSLSLFVFRSVTRNFGEGKRPLTARSISVRLKLPLSVVRTVLDDLVECRLVSEVTLKRPKSKAFLPAREYHTLRVGEVLRALDRKGDNSLIHLHSEALKPIEAINALFLHKMEDASKDITIDKL